MQHFSGLGARGQVWSLMSAAPSEPQKSGCGQPLQQDFRTMKLASVSLFIIFIIYALWAEFRNKMC